MFANCKVALERLLKGSDLTELQLNWDVLTKDRTALCLHRLQHLSMLWVKNLENEILDELDECCADWRWVRLAKAKYIKIGPGHRIKREIDSASVE
jgi:hypothetical protein